MSHTWDASTEACVLCGTPKHQSGVHCIDCDECRERRADGARLLAECGAKEGDMADVGYWWECGSQANAAANAQMQACAQNQGAQAEALSLNHGKRLAELEAENAKLREMLSDSAEAKIDLGIGVTAANARASEASARDNALADECGRLRDENTQLLAENARLRRGKR